MPMGMEPGDLNVYGASDYAVTRGVRTIPFTLWLVLINKQNMYVLDLWREQTTSDKWVEAFCDLVKQWKPLGWAEESGQINAAVGPFLVKRMRERKLCGPLQFPSTKSKAMRAQSIIGRMAHEWFVLSFWCFWFPEFRRELLLFDAGRYDDQVDALA
jgi:predicted phage terminase large subunit-like protein